MSNKKHIVQVNVWQGGIILIQLLVFFLCMKFYTRWDGTYVRGL